MFHKWSSVREANENISQWEDTRKEDQRGCSNQGFGLELIAFKASNVAWIWKFWAESKGTQSLYLRGSYSCQESLHVTNYTVESRCSSLSLLQKSIKGTFWVVNKIIPSTKFPPPIFGLLACFLMLVHISLWVMHVTFLLNCVIRLNFVTFLGRMGNKEVY